VFVCPEPASAQLVVFDPNNYAQNVLTAARALQQINNQIVSLQNQAQMLINQAKNLATLPFSSLLQLEQSIQRTQQLLARLNASPMISNRSTVRSPRLMRRHPQAFQTRVDRKRANALAERNGRLQDAMRTEATVVGNSIPTAPRCRRSSPRARVATGALQASQAAISSWRCKPATRRSHGRRRGPWSRTNLESAQHAAAQDQGREQLRRFLTQGQGYQPTTYRVSLMNTKTLERLPTATAMVLVVLVLPLAQSGYVTTRPNLPAASADQASDALTAKLAKCRSVTYEQKDALSECRKAWAEKRRHSSAEGFICIVGEWTPR